MNIIRRFHLPQHVSSFGQPQWQSKTLFIYLFVLTCIALDGRRQIHLRNFPPYFVFFWYFYFGTLTSASEKCVSLGCLAAILHVFVGATKCKSAMVYKLPVIYSSFSFINIHPGILKDKPVLRKRLKIRCTFLVYTVLLKAQCVMIYKEPWQMLHLNMYNCWYGGEFCEQMLV